MTLATILITGEEPQIRRVVSTSGRVPGRIPTRMTFMPVCVEMFSS